jgi:hypothetical protein
LKTRSEIENSGFHGIGRPLLLIPLDLWEQQDDERGFQIQANPITKD